MILIMIRFEYRKLLDFIAQKNVYKSIYIVHLDCQAFFLQCIRPFFCLKKKRLLVCAKPNTLYIFYIFKSAQYVLAV